MIRPGMLHGRCLIRPAGLALLLVSALPVLAGQYAPPDLTGFTRHAERDADGDGDGTSETHITQYLDKSGDSVVSLSSKGRVWAWSLESRNTGSGERNYVIRDSDCDGQYDEIYGLDEQFHVPDCLK